MNIKKTLQRQSFIKNLALGLLLEPLFVLSPSPSIAQTNISTRPDSTVRLSSQESKFKGFPLPFLKDITLEGKLPIKLSIGGQFREYYQHYQNEKWGDIPLTWNDKNGFYWHRLMLSSGWQFGKKVNLFFELKSGLTTSRAGGNRQRIDYNEMDVHQLYLQVLTWQNAESNLKLKIGRQEYFFGAQRMFTEREGPNNRASFNGATLIFQKNIYQLTTFLAKPVYDNFYVFDDSAIKSQTVWGMNLSHQQKGSPNKWELYYYGYSNSKLKLADVIGKDHRHTIGLFWLTGRKGWRIEAEPALQFGQFTNKTVCAYSFYGSVQKLIPISQSKNNTIYFFGRF